MSPTLVHTYNPAYRPGLVHAHDCAACLVEMTYEERRAVRFAREAAEREGAVVTEGSLAYLVCECCLVLVPPERPERDGALIVPSGRCRRCFHHEAQGIVCKGGRVAAEYVSPTPRDGQPA